MDSRQIMAVRGYSLSRAGGVVKHHAGSTALENIISFIHPGIVPTLASHNLTGKSACRERVETELITVVFGKNKIRCHFNSAGNGDAVNFQGPSLGFQLERVRKGSVVCACRDSCGPAAEVVDCVLIWATVAGRRGNKDSGLIGIKKSHIGRVCVRVNKVFTWAN